MPQEIMLQMSLRNISYGKCLYKGYLPAATAHRTGSRSGLDMSSGNDLQDNSNCDSLGCPLKEFITEVMHRASTIEFQLCKFQYEFHHVQNIITKEILL